MTDEIKELRFRVSKLFAVDLHLMSIHQFPFHAHDQENS